MGFRSSKRNGERIIHTVCVLCMFLGFVSLMFRGNYLQPDSNGYINHSISREPGYPMLIYFIKLIFGIRFHYVLLLLQAILACFSGFYFCRRMSGLFKLKGIWLIALYAIVCLYYDFITVIFTSWGRPLISCVLTEGIVYPLFLIYFTLGIQALCYREKKSWLIALIVLGIMYFIRHSMAYILVVHVVLALYIDFAKVKKYLLDLLLVLCVLVITTVAEGLYFYAFTGHYTSRSFVSVNSSLNFILLAEEDDIERIDDENAKVIFFDVYHQMAHEDIVLSGERVNDSLLERSEHIAEYHDYVMFDVLVKRITEYLDESGIIGEVERAKEIDRIADAIYKPLIQEHFGQWVKGYAGISLASFIASVCPIATPDMPTEYIALVFYILLGVLIIVNRKDKKYQLISVFSILSVCGCVFANAIFMQCLLRLQMYNVPVLYFAVLLGTKILTVDRREKSKGNKKI